MKENEKSVYFVDGYSPRRGLIGVVAYLYELKDSDEEFSRIYTVLDEDWAHVDIEHAVVSLTNLTSGPDRGWWLLGKRGTVTKLVRGETSTETITQAGTGPGKNGYLDKIVCIGDELYTCGYRRQVYKRTKQGWLTISQSILAQRRDIGFGFTSMDGNAPDQMYAVGYKGEIFNFDGKAWRKLESPTNANLKSVRVFDKELVAVSGDKGVLLLGNENGWDVIQSPEFPHTLWAVEFFADQIYVASSYGLAKVTDRSLVPVDTGKMKPTNGYKLHSRDGFLWSVGTDQIIAFDGERWRELRCPDNET